MSAIPLWRVFNTVALGLAGLLALDYFGAIPIGASNSYFPVTLEGEVRTVIVDYGGERLLTSAEEHTYLSSGDGAPWVRLDFPSTPPVPRPEPWQTRIQATGWFHDARLEVERFSVLDVRRPDPADLDSDGRTHHLLAVRVVVAGRPFPVSEVTMEEHLFAPDSVRPTSAHAYFRNASHGVVAGFRGQVVTIEAPEEACSLEALEAVVDPLLQAQGVNPAAFDHVLYAQADACPFVLLSEVHGRRSIQDAPGRPELTLHAIGHNLGARHASREHQGEIWEFGDFGDIMGNGRAAPHATTRAEVGWLSGPQIGRIAAPGIHAVHALALDPDSTQAPRALVVADPETGDHYLVSYRSGVSEADRLPAVLQDRVFVHRIGIANPVLVAVLAEGDVFVPRGGTVGVAFTSRAPDSATVQVDLPRAPAGD